MSGRPSMTRGRPGTTLARQHPAPPQLGPGGALIRVEASDRGAGRPRVARVGVSSPAGARGAFLDAARLVR